MATIAESRATSIEAKPLTTASLAAILGGAPTATGKAVNETTALGADAVWACVRVISEDVAKLPLVTYRRLQPRGKERVPNHPLYSLLHDQPNPLMGSLQFRETMQAHLCTWGNAYAEIERDDVGRPVGLWPLNPRNMQRPERSRADTLLYPYTLPNGQPVVFPQARMFHLRGLSFDGVVGYSPIAVHRETVGLDLALKEYGARFFGNGARPGGVLQSKTALSQGAIDRLKASWEMAHQGLSQAHRVAILEEGLEWKQVGLPNEDAQYIDAQKLSVLDIARIYRVPPHKIADLDRATYSNIESQSISFVTDTLLPWLVRWEQQINMDLLLPSERATYFVEHLVSGLLRGDTQSRFAAYAVGRQWGWLSADDIRELENMNPLPDGQGAIYLVPLNMTPADKIGELPPPKDIPGPRALPGPAETRAAGGNHDSRRRLAQAYHRLFLDAATRVVRREANEVEQAAERLLSRRSTSTLLTWLDEFYAEWPTVVERAFAPVVSTYAEAIHDDAAAEIGEEPDAADLASFAAALAATYAGSHARKSANQLREVLTDTPEADQLAAVRTRLDEWREKRPEKIARNETVVVAGAVVRETWKRRGRRTVTWVVSGDRNCPYCEALAGRTVGIDSDFLAVGQSFQPGGADKPLNVKRRVGHPPAHRGCDCGLAAEVVGARRDAEDVHA